MSKKIMLLIGAAAGVGAAAWGAVFHVAVDAPADGDGSASRPFATPHAAVAAARVSPGADEIVVRPGTDYFDRTLQLERADSPLTIRAEREGTAVFSGGVAITGWRPEPGTPYWTAEIPDVATNGWFFRSLVVDGRLAKRAEYPGGTNRLFNTRNWTVRWMSSVGNGWERPPTDEERCTMPYRPGDLPATMDWQSADVRAYHSWDDSLVRTASNDVTRSLLFFRTPMRHPAGSFRNPRYVVYNVREGMTEPGQWYLSVPTGRLTYWPLPGEDMTRVRVTAPRLETLVSMRGQKGKPVSHVTFQGLVFEGTMPPARAASYGGTGLPGTLDGGDLYRCVLDRVTLRATGAVGVNGQRMAECRIQRSRFLNTGSCGLVVSGIRNEILSNRIERAGRVFTAACGASISGSDYRVIGNDISEVPYCGICFGGKRHLYEGNRVRRVMTLMDDGAAFYGGGASGQCVIRNNEVTDIVPANQKGTGCSAFYFDEGAHDGIVESNRTDGVALPVHNHMARRLTIRGNVFAATNTITLSFARCLGCTFADNEIRTDGNVRITVPGAFSTWTRNRRYPYAPLSVACEGDGTELVRPEPKRLGPRKDALPVPYTAVAPALDGTFSAAAWPGVWSTLESGLDGRSLKNAPVWIRAAQDGTNLWLAVRVALFNHENLAIGHDPVTSDAVTFEAGALRLTGYADGTSNARAFYGGYEKEKKKGFGKMGFYVFRVPLADLGVTPRPQKGTVLPFNCFVRNAVYGETRCWEAPSGARVRPGRLVFK